MATKNDPLGSHREEVAMICEVYGVERLELFGSATSDAFDPASSDLDFLVEFVDKSPGYANRYLRFAEALETLFDRNVDVVTERSIANPYFRDILNATRQLVYDRHREEAVV
jgi:hypothetical protein